MRLVERTIRRDGPTNYCPLIINCIRACPRAVQCWQVGDLTVLPDKSSPSAIAFDGLSRDLSAVVHRLGVRNPAVSAQAEKGDLPLSEQERALTVTHDEFAGDLRKIIDI